MDVDVDVYFLTCRVDEEEEAREQNKLKLLEPFQLGLVAPEIKPQTTESYLGDPCPFQLKLFLRKKIY